MEFCQSEKVGTLNISQQIVATNQSKISYPLHFICFYLFPLWYSAYMYIILL